MLMDETSSTNPRLARAARKESTNLAVLSRPCGLIQRAGKPGIPAGVEFSLSAAVWHLVHTRHTQRKAGTDKREALWHSPPRRQLKLPLPCKVRIHESWSGAAGCPPESHIHRTPIKYTTIFRGQGNMHPQHARMCWWRELSPVNQGECQWLSLAPDEGEIKENRYTWKCYHPIWS